MNWFLKKKTKEDVVEQLPRSGPMIRISESLSDETITVLRADLPKRELFSKLVDLLKLPEPEIILRSVLAREQIGSTVIEKGLAIPHARIHGLRRIHAALGIIPDADVSLCLLFVGPTDDMKGHLGFLAAAASLFQNEEFRQSLTRLGNSRAIIERILMEERKVQEAES